MQVKNTTKTVALCSAIFLSVISVTSLQAQKAATKQTPSKDEQAIRSLVAQENEGKHVVKLTDDAIFVSGAYPRPIIGKTENESVRAASLKSGERINYIQKMRIERLTVAAAGDMAYDFGYADLSWDTKDQKHVSFESSYVRIWRKVNGQWKGEVFFARPNTDESPDSK